MKVRYDLHYTTAVRAGEKPKQFWVEFYTQPLLRILVAKAYHRYDMNKLVHWISHRIERDYGMLSGEGHRRDESGNMVPFKTEPTPFTVPLCAKQDERCYYLSRKGRVDLARIEVNVVEYNAIKTGITA